MVDAVAPQKEGDGIGRRVHQKVVEEVDIELLVVAARIVQQETRVLAALLGDVEIGLLPDLIGGFDALVEKVVGRIRQPRALLVPQPAEDFFAQVPAHLAVPEIPQVRPDFDGVLNLEGVGQLQGVVVQLLVELADPLHHPRVVAQVQIDLLGLFQLPFCPQGPGLRVVAGQQQVLRVLVFPDLQQQLPGLFIVPALQAPAPVEILLLQGVVVAQGGHFFIARLQVEGLGLGIGARGKEPVSLLPVVQKLSGGPPGEDKHRQHSDPGQPHRRPFPGQRRPLLFLHAHSVK